MSSRSLLIINYRSAALAADAVRTARAASSHPLQTVIVDNSTDPAEAEMLRTFADVVLTPSTNLGYAGGINAGRPACDGDVMIVSNPDVAFAPGAIDRLVDVNAAVAGPALFWDGAYRWMLPPAELHTRREVASRVLASRLRVWARARDRSRFLSRVAFWSLDRPTPCRALSGAVMAIQTRAFDDAGGFDDRFQLYFEENDFLRRVRGEIVYVPSARCRHLYNQSAAGSPGATALFAQSERRYLEKWGGTLFKKLERELPIPRAPARRVNDAGTAIVVEASPLASFDTAAGLFTSNPRPEVPDDLWDAYRGEVLHFRVRERRSGHILDSWSKVRIRS